MYDSSEKITRLPRKNLEISFVVCLNNIYRKHVFNFFELARVNVFRREIRTLPLINVNTLFMCIYNK